MTGHRAALVMASHDINLVSQMCDHVLLLMGDGKYLAGPVSEILQEASVRPSGAVRRVESGKGEAVFFFPQPDVMAVLKGRVCGYRRELDQIIRKQPPSTPLRPCGHSIE